MAKKYYTLVAFEDGSWAPQFGDYDKEVVEQEKEDYCYSNQLPKRLVKIVTTQDKQADINAAVSKLNA